MASTSEVYGDPLVHPQPETYWGNVDPIGPRSMYDESKRFAEALVMAYVRTQGADARIARIFNAYGPRMQINDGRMPSTFIAAALGGEAVPVHGDGSQTRSLCFVTDTVRGLIAAMERGKSGLQHRPCRRALGPGIRSHGESAFRHEERDPFRSGPTPRYSATPSRHDEVRT
jgi:dTDP-glucose 4,6-dehydratase